MALALAGCTGGRANNARAPATARYSNTAYHVALSYPSRLQATARFAGDYLLAPRWNPDAAADVTGKPLLALKLPESNNLLDARLRLGASARPAARADCQGPSTTNVAPGFAKPRTVAIDGVKFTRYTTGDAGMSHFLQRHSYRGVHQGVCYAVDLVVSGVNPGVYANKPTPPMTRNAAFKRLTALLDGLSFTNG